MALKTDAIVFASTANNANFIVVGICGVLFFGEQVSLSKGLAVLFILVACIFMVKYQKGVGSAPRLRDAVLLFTVFLAGGLTSVTEKCFARFVPNVSSHLYTFYTFAFSILILLCVRIAARHPSGFTVEQKREKIKLFLPYAAVMGFAIYGVTYFKTLANSYLDTIVLYPLNNGLTLVASALMAWACFGEKPNKNSIIGMFLIFSALLLSSGTAADILARLF
jgi:drug/metabolite transporter (DMT)-like permease